MVENIELKILDELLRTLLISNSIKWDKIMNETIDRCQYFENVEQYTFQMALLKLSKDDYVMITNKNVNEPIKSDFRISFEGIVFIKNGGYITQLDKNQMQQNLNDFLKSQQTRHSKILVRLNYWLVFGAILVAIDSIMNILHFFGVYFDTSNLIFCVKPT